MHRAQEAESWVEAWEDRYSRLLGKARNVKATLGLARERIVHLENAREEDERYIRLQKDIVSDLAREIEDQREERSSARYWQLAYERCERERDRAVKALDALTNHHSYEACFLTKHKQMRRIPLAHRERIGDLLDMACLEARSASGDAQAADALQAFVDPVGPED